MQTVDFNVPSISCSSCSNKIQENIKELKGVGDVSINFKSQNIKVEYNPSEVDPQEIKNHISQMGYEIN